MANFKCCLLLAAALASCNGQAWAGEAKTPSWVQEVSTRAVPAYPAKVPVAVLLDEERIVVDGSGRTTTTVRRAVKILNREGRNQAEGGIAYLNGSAKVKELHAWLIAPGGFTKAYGKDKAIDLASYQESLYDEYRYRMIREPEPEVGAVFAYEIELEEKTVFTQVVWLFQNRLPSLQSRFTMTLPPGWTAASTVANHEALTPIVDGSTSTWELKDLPYIEREAFSPSFNGLAPRLQVSFFPPAGQEVAVYKSWKSWPEVSTWLSELSSGQDQASDESGQKAKQLTAGAASEYERIRAISQYVQNVKYISIQTGLARGGGYRPHAAGIVFQKQYGDCKDKANLMKSMLGSVGIQAYLLSVYSGDRLYVRDDWPSPMQFNHAIVAVRVQGETKAPTVIEGGPLGRLLIFDPTDEHTPLGDLPEHEQGSFGLVEAGSHGALLRLPVTPPDTDHEDMTIEATLGDQGALKAVIVEGTRGQAAAEQRRHYAHQRPEDSMKHVERWLSYGAKNVSVSKLEPVDAFAKGEFHLQVDFEAPHYGQLMQDRMLVFRPGIAEAQNSVYFSDKKRTQPIVLESQSFHKQVRVKMPEGFKVDELPNSGQVETTFGKYSASYKVEGSDLLFQQDLKLQAATIPASEYAQVKKFFDQVWASGHEPVVLVKN